MRRDAAAANAAPDPTNSAETDAAQNAAAANAAPINHRAIGTGDNEVKRPAQSAIKGNSRLKFFAWHVGDAQCRLALVI